MKNLSGYFAKKAAMVVSLLRGTGQSAATARYDNQNVRLVNAPTAVQLGAMRKEIFYGEGNQQHPFVGGWLIQSRKVSRDPQALGWLVENGFKRYGEYWGRPDDSMPRVPSACWLLVEIYFQGRVLGCFRKREQG